MLPAYVIWLVLTVAFAVVEAATLGLTSIWFALGSLAAMLCSLLHAPLWLQILVFVAVSAVAVWLTRDLAQERFNRSRQPTNADRIIGRQGQVLEEIDNARGAGLVRVDGAVWTARSADGQCIPAGSSVTIRAIEGVKVLVTPQA